MRYFVLERSYYPDVSSHIVAEVAGYPQEEGEDPRDLARALASSRSDVFGLDELLASPEGKLAYYEWTRGNDHQFEEENRRLLAEARADEVSVSESRTRERGRHAVFRSRRRSSGRRGQAMKLRLIKGGSRKDAPAQS